MMIFVKSAFMALFFTLSLTMSALGGESFHKGQAVIQTGSGQQHRLRVEYAKSAKEREQGLMGRTALGPDDGMIFDFGRSQTVVMWMKNTPLSLDMVFVDEKGVVTRVADKTTPYSEALIPSEGAVRYVVELNGGRAKSLGIGKGSRFVQGLQPEK
jgi:uncharacterized protein